MKTSGKLTDVARSYVITNSVISGTINLPIARKSNSIIERCISPYGDTAITHFNILKEFTHKSNFKSLKNSTKKIIQTYSKAQHTYTINCCFSIVEFKLETGRTHQIRVHTSYFNCPILGDSLYGHYSTLINRQALHSYYLKFIHPETRKYVEFQIGLPQDILSIINT